MSETFQSFVERHLTVRQPLEMRAARAWWTAATTGDAQAYREEARLKTRLETLLADRDSFELLHRLREERAVTDPVQRRLLDLLYLEHLGRRCSPDLLEEIVHLASEVEETFAKFRPELDGRRLSANEIDDLLRTSTDVGLRRRAWEASKQVGPHIADRVRRLVRLRNRMASEQGYSDYYGLALTLGEQAPRDVARLFDELDRLTRGPYLAAKSALDLDLASRFGITADELRPWHYADPFFQEVPDPVLPEVQDVFRDRDLLQLATAFFEGIGLEVASILERSDLYEREGKNPHAFCIDIDREGDVRVLLNLRPTSRWMSTVLHELGHGVYDLGVRRDLPYPLRRPAHTFVTEGIALFFGRMPFTSSWLRRTGLLQVGPESERALRAHQVLRQQVFARWCQVMVRFERALYRDPDANLQELWWNLVERYQGLRRPPRRSGEDWATKIHIVSSPVYYHNYAIGELFASQLLRAVLEELGQRSADEGAIVKQPQVGTLLAERVFRPGALMPWRELVRHATGRGLAAEDFARQFAG